MAPGVRAQNFENAGPIVAIATLPGCSQSCFGMPAFSITAAHLAMSLFIASGVAAAHLHAQLAYLLLDIRTRQDLVMARVRTLTTALGVAAGTEMPFQLTTSKSLIPVYSWSARMRIPTSAMPPAP